MGREKKLLQRKQKLRTYKKLFVIATEGEKTEKNYFKEIQESDLNDSDLIRIEILESPDGESSPKHVLKRLTDYKKKYPIIERDELWLVIDKDRWGEGHLSEVAQETMQKGFYLAVSNPCFELWLYLHYKNVSELSNEEKLQIEENKKYRKWTYLETLLKKAATKYSKTQIGFPEYIQLIPRAIDNAKLLDTSTDDRWPQTLGTRVYLLVEKLVK